MFRALAWCCRFLSRRAVLASVIAKALVLRGFPWNRCRPLPLASALEGPMKVAGGKARPQGETHPPVTPPKMLCAPAGRGPNVPPAHRRYRYAQPPATFSHPSGMAGWLPRPLSFHSKQRGTENGGLWNSPLHQRKAARKLARSKTAHFRRTGSFCTAVSPSRSAG